MRVLSVLAFALVVCGSVPASAQQFPYEQELVLDAAPMRGSKRIPNMDVALNGTMAFEMWCNRVEGQLVVAADTITVIAGKPTERSCPPERARADAELLETLGAVTTWRRQGDSVL